MIKRKLLQSGIRARTKTAAVIIFALIAIGAYALFVFRLRPLVRDLAAAQVNTTFTDIVNKALIETLEEQQISFADMVYFEKDSGGRVSALCTDPVQLNMLKAAIESKVLSMARSATKIRVKVPLGALMGANIFADAGPVVCVKMSAAKEMDGAFQSRFGASGINQSIHTLVFAGKISCILLYPGANDEVSVPFSVVAAQTVIVGEVPESYTYFSGVETTNDAIDYYYNYS